jgi:predicted aspartyl protease
MGEIKVYIELENSADRYLFFEKKIKQKQVRRYSMEALVDTGAVMLMLPQEVTEKLGLQFVRKATVTYADERKESRSVVGAVTVKVGDRFMNTDCIVGPPSSEASVGQIILETLDLIPDSLNKSLHPRPESPIYPSIKMK